MSKDYIDQLCKIMLDEASSTVSVVAAILIREDGSKRIINAKIGSSTGHNELQIKNLVNDCRKLVGPKEQLKVVKFNGITISDLESVATSIFLLTEN